MTKRKSDFTLPTNSLDELFSSQEERDDAKLERVKEISLYELHPFKDHPFKIQNNEEMKRLIESIQKFGTLTPALARPMPEGGYELISGHRRLAACQVLGIETMPVIVREMSDDEAVIAMVDANLQREHILPSEKAFAYKMKRDALNHQGIASPQVGEKLLTVEKIGADSGDSKNQVLRYIRLTYLIPELLEMVDENKIAFNPAVEDVYKRQDHIQCEGFTFSEKHNSFIPKIFGTIMIVQPGNAIPCLPNIKLHDFISVIFVDQIIYSRTIDTGNIFCF